VAVVRREAVTPRLVRVTLGGPEVAGLVVDEPAASVRVLLPPAHDAALVIPRWAGNEFLLPDGSRPVIRTLTPRRVDPGALELDVDVVVHGAGSASTWARSAQPGDRAAVSGPARGYAVDPDAADFLLAGDETALPAIAQLLDAIPAGRPVRAVIEIAAPDARLEDLARSGATLTWVERSDGAMPGQALVPAVAGAPIGPDTRVWVAGEAAAVQAIRRQLFEQRGIPRVHATVRGYWKHGRGAGGNGEA
jgi:NADPH-dependent ferric siderophore reductase